MRGLRALVLGVAGVCASGLLIMSVWRELPHTLDRMHSQRAAFAPLSAKARAQAFGTSVPVPMEIFDFYAAHLRPGDRYWVQVDPGAFGQFADKAKVVRSVGRLELMPAVEVERPDDADVILSWEKDPGLLPYRYSEQYRAGLQLLFVSRVRR